MKRKLLMAAIGVAILLPVSTVQAQTSAVEQLYGQSVHHYHAGRIAESMASITEAIRTGSQDPRLYYYRGLAHNSMGDTKAATTDFQAGAQLELANRSGRNYAVGRALERVQGPVRMQIEEARRNARLAAAPAGLTPSEMLGNKAQSNGARPPVIPNTRRGNIANKQTNFPDVTGVENPGTPYSGNEPPPRPREKSSKPDSFPAEEAKPVVAEKPKREEADPFGDPEASEEPAKEADPFGGGEEMEEEQGDEDPFGGDDEEEDDGDDEDEDDDPFG